MTKDRIIILRVDEATKRRFEQAAQQKGETVTTFLTHAGEQAASRLEKLPPRGVHGGVPGYFRASCFEAERGGDRGYDAAGYHLAIHLGDEQPDDMESKAWWKEIKALVALIENEDDDGVLAWFEEHYPKCLALIPKRRREQFVKGVYRAHEDDRIRQ